MDARSVAARVSRPSRRDRRSSSSTGLSLEGGLAAGLNYNGGIN
ncbi:MAG: hypothetical protein U0165_11660 [Polyangiaceae bacterium]